VNEPRRFVLVRAQVKAGFGAPPDSTTSFSRATISAQVRLMLPKSYSGWSSEKPVWRKTTFVPCSLGWSDHETFVPSQNGNPPGQSQAISAGGSSRAIRIGSRTGAPEKPNVSSPLWASSPWTSGVQKAARPERVAIVS
jgi:hypothetical protein